MGSIFTSTLNIIASFLWACATAWARRFSKRRTRLPARVISIGNIQVGGAGKTPLVAFLARQAHERGIQVCILTRGYGSNWERQGGVLEPRQIGSQVGSPKEWGPDECGDEALLLNELAPHAWIGVGADRAKQFEAVSQMLQAKGKSKIDWVILDDGFQNHRLEKDLDIVALTSARWGQKIFRDFRSALKLANLLVWTKGDERPKSFGRPMVKMRIELPSAQEDGAKYLLVTGLADGNQARLAMEKAGYLIQRHLTFPDHARYALAVMDSILEDVKRQGLKLALTGKDWVKWRSYIVEKGLESMVRVLEPELRLDPHDEKIWSQVLWER